MSPTLTLTRTVLRPFTNSDADLVFALHRDADVARVVPFRPHASLDDARQLLTRILVQNTTRLSIGWVITLEGKGIGTVGLVRIDHEKKQSDIAYHVAREHWGGGLAAEAVRGVLGLGFGELLLQRVYARIDSMNVRSCQFAERLGFVRDSTFTERFDGAERTTHRYVVVAS